MTDLDSIQKDALLELVNIGVGRAAYVPNTMLDTHITLRVPSLTFMSAEDLTKLFDADGGEMSSVHLEFDGPFSGKAALVFTVDAANKLVSVVNGDEEAPDEDFDSMRIGTLEEIGNIVINGVLGAINNILGGHMNFTVPMYQEGHLHSLIEAEPGGPPVLAMVANTNFSIQSHDIEGNLVTVFGVNSLDNLLSCVLRTQS